LRQCCNKRERHNHPKKGALKILVLAFFGKWIKDTYVLVEESQNSDLEGFDPYKLLHLENDATFDTPAIKNAYRRLSVKYHPDKVDYSKVDKDKALRRYRRLILAYETLTKEDKYQNYIRFGDPNGSMSTKAIGLAVPTFILDEAFRPKLISGALGLIFIIVLSIISIVNKTKNNCSNGVLLDTKANIEQFIVAVIMDNDNNQTNEGFKFNDLIEMYE
jgi:translocation protein SEC63